MGQEQGGGHVARPVWGDREGKPRRGTNPGAGLFDQQHLDHAVGTVCAFDAGYQHKARPGIAQPSRGRDQPRQIVGVIGAQGAQFELVGGQDVGARQGGGAKEVGHGFGHIEPPVFVPHHRVAAIERRGIGGFGALDRGGDHRAQRRVPDIAAQHRIASVHHPPIGDPLQDIAHRLRRQDRTTDPVIAGMVGKQHRMDRPHTDPQPLQRKHRRRVADMAIGDMGLDGQNVHPLAIHGGPALYNPARRRAGECGWLGFIPPRGIVRSLHTGRQTRTTDKRQ